ncbi:MAG: DUF998 domain-containing protein [Candidatus Microthrix sp.]|nr:DUF998 domain-containing protein [Candidatus Microthrix sp.]
MGGEDSTNPAVGRLVGVVGLICSAAALALVPLVLPASYSWVEHTTSEAGAQGVDGAWLARAGFVLFGLAVLWIASRRRCAWGRLATGLHVTFGVSMIAVAAFSLRSWLPGATFDPTEDELHSVAATVMGFAFAFGVLAAAVRRRTSGQPWRTLDLIAIATSVAVPLGMTVFVSADGVLQRLMFAVAYLWYGGEAWADFDRRGRSEVDQ